MTDNKIHNISHSLTLVMNFDILVILWTNHKVCFMLYALFDIKVDVWWKRYKLKYLFRWKIYLFVLSRRGKHIRNKYLLLQEEAVGGEWVSKVDRQYWGGIVTIKGCYYSYLSTITVYYPCFSLCFSFSIIFPMLMKFIMVNYFCSRKENFGYLLVCKITKLSSLSNPFKCVYF